MRVVSLVPSLTETLFALGLSTDEVVGRTPWCVHPQPQVAEVTVVGGTKTPNLNKLRRQHPDLVVLDREENTRETWDALDADGISVWVAEVRTVAEVPAMLRSLGEAVARARRADELAREIEQLLAEPLPRVDGGNPPVVLPLIWHEPLMALSPDRYGGNLIECAGFRVPPIGDSEAGYPTVTPGQIGDAGVTHLFLTSEPHDFTAAEGMAIADSVATAGYPRPQPVHVDGEALTWFGAHTAAGLRTFRELFTELLSADRRP